MEGGEERVQARNQRGVGLKVIFGEAKFGKLVRAKIATSAKKVK